VAKELRKWLANTGTKASYIEPGSPWENGYCESFNSKLRDEFLNGEIFYSMKEIRVLAERCEYTSTRYDHTLRWATTASSCGMDRDKLGHGEAGIATLIRLPTPHTALSELRDSCATLTI